MDTERTPFESSVARVLGSLEPGDVVTYGEVAAEAGHPRHARAVGRFLATNDGHPWWRVVNAIGRLVPDNVDQHSQLLRAEGVEIRNGHVVGMGLRS